jgi:hypothetical protein
VRGWAIFRIVSYVLAGLVGCVTALLLLSAPLCEFGGGVNNASEAEIDSVCVFANWMTAALFALTIGLIVFGRFCGSKTARTRVDD